MGLFGWLKKQAAEDSRLTTWRTRWEAAVSGPASAVDVERLRGELDALALPEEEIEIEREMLDGLEGLAQLQAASELPVVPTGHRIVGAETCHFSAPVSMPDEPAQPGGRLLLTATRGIFVGGASGSAIAWHTVAEVAQAGRDVVLVRKDRARLYRFRFNSYGDALAAAELARRLVRRG
jgi:hypothetical protein